jgi:hypothetical protein
MPEILLSPTILGIPETVLATDKQIHPYPYWQSQFEDYFNAAGHRGDVAGVLYDALHRLQRFLNRRSAPGVIPSSGRRP